MRTLLTTLTIVLALLPAGALAASAPAPLLEPSAPLDAALQDEARLQRLAAAFPAGAGLSAQLATATGGAPLALPAVDFDAALAALYAQANVAMPAHHERPDAALADALAPVLVALSASARLTEEAFADLDADERAFLLDNLALTLAPSSAPELDAVAADLHALAARVDVAKIEVGAATIADALDRFAWPGGMQTSWSPIGLPILVGSTGNDYYCAEQLLIIDLGGNDVYDCHPAAYAPGSSLPLPVSVILDLGGNDQYTTTTLHASSPHSTWGQAVGIGGIGLIVDRWGDDLYQTYLYDATQHCDFDWITGAPQTIYAQAVGASGVGAILDLSGNDHYLAINVNGITVNCHFGWVYTFAQAVGLGGGVGLLVDDTGDDQYYAYSYALGKYDNIAGTFAQAAAAGGLAILADKEGSDWYYTDAQSYITFGFTKGAFAYTFSQASVLATRKQPPVSNLVADIGLAQAELGICPSALDGSAASLRSGGCDGPGAALLVDVLGDDSFWASSNGDDLGRGCSNGLWAVVSSQGSAAWTGAATLVNLDVEGRDTFRLQPNAKGTNCGYPGVRAHAYGQGFGGPILWNFWDLPLPQGVEQRPIGILASLGIPGETCIGQIGAQFDLPLPQTVAPDIRVSDPCPRYDGTIPHLTPSPDAYEAVASATNPSYTANAEAWVQGASQRLVVIPSYWTGTYPALGIGVHLDVGGDDTLKAEAHAKGPKPDALVAAQASTDDALSVLANVGGADVYSATATHNGIAMPALTLVQGYALSGTTLSTPGPICASVSIVLVCVFPVTVAAGGIAVFVDIFGEDAYSEAPERFGCQANGTLLGSWPLGVPLGPVWWGTVIGNPCPPPTPDVGTGTVIGLDWWSEAN